MDNIDNGRKMVKIYLERWMNLGVGWEECLKIDKTRGNLDVELHPAFRYSSGFHIRQKIGRFGIWSSGSTDKERYASSYARMNVGLPSRKNWRKNADEAKGKTVLMMLLSFSLSSSFPSHCPRDPPWWGTLDTTGQTFRISLLKIDSFNNEQGKNQRH